MRWIVALLAVALALSPVTALAEDSDDTINVIAVPYTGGGLLSFTATYVSDTQVDLAWTFAAGTTYVLIRSKYGSEPTDETDGVVVYYGDATSFSDTSMNFDETAGTLYYKAFGELSPGVYGFSLGANIGGLIVALIFFGTMPVILSIAAFWKRQIMLALLAALFWAFLGGYAYYTYNVGSNVIYQYLGFAGFMLSVVFALVALSFRAKKDEEPETYESFDDQLAKARKERLESKLKKANTSGMTAAERRAARNYGIT